MSTYKIRILTENFVPFNAGKRNNPYEEMNAYMSALNGWEKEENSDLHVLWRIDYFFFCRSHFKNPEWLAWFQDRRNFVSFTTESRTFYRASLYQDSGKRDDIIPELMSKLACDGRIEIPFSVTFDDHHFEGCKMIVERISD